jgi:hypothetical protein
MGSQLPLDPQKGGNFPTKGASNRRRLPEAAEASLVATASNGRFAYLIDMTETATDRRAASGLAIPVLDLVATRPGESAGNAIARTVELARSRPGPRARW